MNPDATTRLQQAIAGGVIGNLMSPSWSGTPDWPAAQRALQDGADIDASLICATGWTLLARACRWNRMDVVRWLLDRRSDPLRASKDGRGYRPLVEAVVQGRTELVRLLLDHVAGRKSADLCTALLHAAASRSVHADVASMLLAHGANPNARNVEGTTALMFAVWTDKVATAIVLLDHGADPNAMDRRSRPVLSHALHGGHQEQVRLLIDRGADPAAVTPNGQTIPEALASADDTPALAAMDQELADPRHAAARRRLLARLTADQRLAWLPKSCIAEAAAKTATCRRRP